MSQSSGNNSTVMTKAEAIFLCLAEPEVDLWRLRELALSDGGLLDDVIRRVAWPKLVGIDRYTDPAVIENQGATSDLIFKPNSSGIPSLKEMDQVQRDVVRCTWHLLSYDQRRIWRGRSGSKEKSDKIASLLRKKQRRLGHLINMILQDGAGSLKYYQGYHDVSSVFLNILGTCGLGLTKATLYKVSLSHFREPMRESFHEIICVLRLTIFPLLAKFHPKLHDHLARAGMEPFFALSWVLSWFSHDVKDSRVASRMFDAFIVAHPLFPIYVSVAMILHPVNRNIILKTECDFAELHNVLCSLPKNTCNYGWRRDGGYGSDDEFDKEVHELRKSMLPLVPVQELFDSALCLMRSVPPQHLLSLASRYRKGSLAELANAASEISLFHPLHSSSFASFAPADWVLKKRSKEEEDEGTTPTKKKRAMGEEAEGTPKMYEKALLSLKNETEEKCIYFKKNSRNRKNALVANGLDRYNKKRRLLVGGILVAILSIAW
eukprot:CAMPEP_0172426408 /NCGR_PEP_ID=MMETSP1064-20121228/37262_1 /TAXON_ID=202472 /ORGANISM="Aulacoseira subarctica , Strain CCAP 1002/5" /LENGTH=490 /DNA_ID=CAMNT_0013169987 /DNA_START=279 /DNA_END=1748 /DNA_ORIENTATION=+